MANREQVAMLRRDVAEWNEWRQRNQSIVPDLRGADLRGCDLRGANLVGADIRSAKFGRRGKDGKAADLTGANLSQAQAGVLWQFVLLQLLIILVMSALSGFLSGFAGWYVEAVFNSNVVLEQRIAVGAVLAIVYPAIFLTIARQGFTAKAAGTIATAFAVAVAVAFAVAVAVAGAGAVAFAVAVAVAVAVAFAVAVAVAGAGAGAGAFAVAGASLLLGLYVARRAKRGDEKFALARQLGLALAAIGGTNFTSANLTKAIFKKSKLKSTTFHNATLTHTNFRNAQHLDKANPGTSLLSNFQILDLLTTPDGHYKKNLSTINLRGAYLAGANLEHCNLTNTNLAEADLTGASLKNANLRETNCIGTTFTRAHLTGACLESWNIDNTTIFKNVDCQYVFLLEKKNIHGSQERRPHNPDKTFQPGDFEKLFSEALNLVEILIRNDPDPEAFRQAFQDLMDKFGVTPSDIQSIAKKGNDLLVALEVREEINKGEVERTFHETYDEIAKLTAERDQARLEAGKYEQRAQKLEDHLLDIATNLSTNAPTFNQTMSQNDNGRNIQMGDGSTYRETNVSDGGQYAERDIINQGNTGISLPEVITLLGQLSQQIQTTPDLPDDLKQKSMRYLGAATAEAEETKPDKQLMGTNLKKMGSLFKEAATTTEAAAKFTKAIAPVMTKIGAWLAMTLI
ncbi:MAG: pentapeptide repeat-containing protein [Cyanobacteria bacterium P01_C01_bin.89]